MQENKSYIRYVIGNPCPQVIDRACLITTGNRYILDLPQPDNPHALPKDPFSEMSHEEILSFLSTESQSLGPVDHIWQAVRSKYAHGLNHILLMQRQPSIRRNINSNNGNPSEWNTNVHNLYSLLGLGSIQLLAQFPYLREIITGVNGEKNKSLEWLFHLHLVGIDPSFWKEVAFNNVPKDRWRLMHNNDGCWEAVADTAVSLARNYPEILVPDFVVTQAASVFMQCHGPFNQVALLPRFGQCMQELDRQLRQHLDGFAHIPEKRRCLAFNVIQQQGRRNEQTDSIDFPPALLNFQIAAMMPDPEQPTIPPRPSGILEAAGHLPHASKLQFDEIQQSAYETNARRMTQVLRAG